MSGVILALPPSYMPSWRVQRQVLAALRIKTCSFCPHSVLVYLFPMILTIKSCYFPKQRKPFVIFSVYCEVRTEFVYIIQVKFLLQGRVMPQAVSRRSLLAEARV